MSQAFWASSDSDGQCRRYTRTRTTTLGRSSYFRSEMRVSRAVPGRPRELDNINRLTKTIAVYGNRRSVVCRLPGAQEMTRPCRCSPLEGDGRRPTSLSPPAADRVRAASSVCIANIMMGRMRVIGLQSTDTEALERCRLKGRTSSRGSAVGSMEGRRLQTNGCRARSTSKEC
jgi:hypothetical protein